MSNLVKYTFEESFDGGTTPARAREAELLAKRQEEIEAAHKEGHAAGHKAGYAQAKAEIEASTAAALNKIAQNLDGLFASHKTVAHSITTEATSLAHAVGSALAKSLMEQYPLAEIENLITQCLHLCTGEARIIIRVAEPMLKPLEHRIHDLTRTQAFDGQIVLIADGKLKGFDCHVEWANGGVERQASTLENEIASIIGRHLNPAAHAAA